MPQKEVIVTRKIQLLIGSDDPVVRADTWATLRMWRHICFRAANYIFTHHFLQEQVKEIMYIHDDMKIKLTDMRKDADGILTTSKMNSTYQVLSSKFKGELPMTILGTLNNLLVTKYNSERTAYQKGERSLRNYKRTIPIPLPPSAFRKMTLVEKGNYYTFSVYGLHFQTYFGSDYTDKRVMWERYLNGEYKLGISSIKIEKNKIYLLAVFKFPKENRELNPELIAEASLSLEVPIVLRFQSKRYEIGTKEDFLYRRVAIQHARSRIQRSLKYCRAKNGMKRQKQRLHAFAEKEQNYVNNKLHLYSKMLVDMCVKLNAGTLVLEQQEEKEEYAKVDQFLLRNWSYHGLKEKIRYKAEQAGIKVISE
ncbi:IS200/IS605 family element transposase accessory protein TnpB [Chitinophaga cymbidii]|nr:IS200/IS605 family element transposase accessory protein TnpB [Chitinophaga cymbidii]